MTDPIARLNAALEDRYRIEREIGEGGMATVYLAKDLRHERKVALKVLKPELAAVVGAERFLAEIKTTANLQHPHILPLHDSGEADGFLFFVMPYVEGDTLRDKIDREKQLSVEEALKITEKVASALDYAHQQGVVHRDIKPGNILLSERGEPTVADFGIALAVAQAGGGRVTETGLSVGTPHYMSPEQATGDRDVDPRTDVYALGCVLYEMLVGDPPYQGSTAQAVLAKILTDPAPKPTKVRSSIPLNVDAAIRKALEKLPADRFSSAEVFAGALADPGFRHGEEVTEAAVGRGQLTPLALALGVLALFLAGGLVWALFRPELPGQVSRLEMTFPPGVGVSQTMGGSKVEVSPDGSTVVFVGASTDGGVQLWQRPLAGLSATPIPGTENSNNPGFSPDGGSIVFATAGRPPTIHAVSLSGGASQTLPVSGVPGRQSPAWGSDGWIYFSNEDFGLSRVPVDGTDAQVITTLAVGETAHYGPVPLPEGAGVLFTLRPAEGDQAEVVALASVETGQYRVLFPGGSPEYAHSGHIVYSRRDGRLYAVSFDASTGRVGTNHRVVVEGVSTPAWSDYALSDSGVLVYLLGLGAAPETELVWVTRDGVPTPVDPDWRVGLPPGDAGWSVSPDGSRVAVTHLADGNLDIWIKELPAGPFYPLTDDPLEQVSPDWTPDGESVIYTGGLRERGEWDAMIRRADLTTDAELFFHDERGVHQPAWDGGWLVYRTPTFGGTSGSRDVMGVRPGVDEVPTPLAADAEAIEAGPELSPSRQILAYSSTEAGRDEVWIESFPDGSQRVPVSTDGGQNPQWGSDDELFFMDQQLRMWAAQIETTPELRVVSRQILFTLGRQFYLPNDPADDFYDVEPGGERFLMARFLEASEDGVPRNVIVVQNFFEELREMVPE